jgi:hypothetical protein
MRTLFCARCSNIYDFGQMGNYQIFTLDIYATVNVRKGHDRPEGPLLRYRFGRV